MNKSSIKDLQQAGATLRLGRTRTTPRRNPFDHRVAAGLLSNKRFDTRLSTRMGRSQPPPR